LQVETTFSKMQHFGLIFDKKLLWHTNFC